MLDAELKKQRARTVRELAEKSNDPFIKGRLQDLVSRYEDSGPKGPTPLTPLDSVRKPQHRVRTVRSVATRT
jgi:hypothetical protein